MIDAFIHCFIGVRRITSLYDLEVAICKNEGVEKFEELELGPLLRHPLILHYFSVNSDVTEVFKITSEEIFSFLWKFVYKMKKYKDITAEGFLDFIAKKQSVESKEKLGIRIKSLGMHISAIRKAGFSENDTIKKSVEALKSKSYKKCRKHPPSSSLKKQLDEPFKSTRSIESFLSEKTDLCGGHKRSFVSSSSNDENSDDCTSLTKNDDSPQTSSSSKATVEKSYLKPKKKASSKATAKKRKAAHTGRLGELVAFKYIIGKAGETNVKWVNEDSETGLPYDITVGEENSKEYIEVKATKSQTKNWFNISKREWQFAVDKGESFSIMHFVLLGNNDARVSVFKNPAKLCQSGKLQLVAMMPKPQEEFPIVS